MELMQAIRERKSYRGSFKSEPIPREELKEIAEAGFLAPSGCNRQTPRIVAVDDPKLVKELAEIYGFEWAMTAPAAILIFTKPEASVDGKFYHIEDLGAAAQNILLAVTDKGYATTWIEGQIHCDGKAEKMAALLNAPEGMEPVIYMPIGIPETEQKQVNKMAFEERVWFNGYEAK